MKNEENPFIENGLYENITMVISESFFSVLDKVISGYCPYAKVDTFFISEKEALHYNVLPMSRTIEFSTIVQS